jgi:hypothetical protein
MTTVRALGAVDRVLARDAEPEAPLPFLAVVPLPSKSTPRTSTPPPPPPMPNRSALATATPTDNGPTAKAPQAIVNPIALRISG